MKKNLLSKNIHQWLLLLVCFVGTLPSWAEDYPRDGIIYDLDRTAKTATVKGLENKSATSAEIRSYAAGCKVTSIGQRAFQSCSALTSINIPSSVTSIGEWAFSDCQSLTSINIPSSVTSIGNGAFNRCWALTSINIPNSVTSIGEWAFSQCSALTSINIPSSVTSIGNGAFNLCSALTSINIPSSVTRIEEDAFRDCSALTSINIPSSVTSIGGSAFCNCSSLTSINIPSSVTSIGEGAFNFCSALTSINIPSSVTRIEENAFRGCSALTSINIPNSVTSIGYKAFYGCSALTSINIPSSVTSIELDAFSGCSALTTLTVDANNPNYSAEGCMLFNKEKTRLICAAGSKKTYDIPSSVTSIGVSAFSGCSALTSINIPNSVTNIGNSAFFNCSSLTSINIPNSVTSIGYYAFSGCSALKAVVLQSNYLQLGKNVFYGCGSIYDISDNLKIALSDDKSYGYTQGTNVNDYFGGTSWYTCGTPTISYKGSAVSDYLWYSSLLDSNTAQYLRTIFQTSTNVQTLISKYNTIYCNLSENLRKDLEDNLQKVDDFASIITEGDAALSKLSVDLSKAYKNVCEAVYGQLGLSDLYKLYAQAEDFTPSLDKTPDYSPLLPTYTIGSNILTSADQLSTNKQETREGEISNLVDGDKNTFFHSTWSTTNEDNAFAYLQIDLKGAYDDLLLYYSKRNGYYGLHGLPIQFHVFATNTPNEEGSWKDCGYSDQLSYRYENQQSGKTILNLDSDYQYIRLQVEKTGDMVQNNGNLYFSLSELLIYPITDYDAAYTEKDGLITDVSQLSSNAVEPTEGSLAALIDNDITTYFHSTWSEENLMDVFHYLQIDLNDAYKQIALKYSKRQVDADNGSPVTLRIEVTNTPEDENSWTDLGTKTCTYDFGNTGLLPLNFGNTAYRHIRLTVEETVGNTRVNDNLFFYWSELHAYTRISKAEALSEATRSALNTAMQQAKAELDAGKATDATYETLQSAYNAAKYNPQFADFAKSSYLTAYSDKALVVPAGVKAAVVTANGEGIRNDYRYNSGDVIPAGTGVLLKGGKGNSFYLSASENTEMAPEDNLLHGTLTDEMTNVAGADKYYKLSYDRATGSEIGFYWGAANGGAFMNKGGKAFLAIPATLQAAQLTGFSLFDLDNNQAVTGIEHATAMPAATLRVYDLNGRRINVNHVDELPQGIYVINGKKVIR